MLPSLRCEFYTARSPGVRHANAMLADARHETNMARAMQAGVKMPPEVTPGRRIRAGRVAAAVPAFREALHTTGRNCRVTPPSTVSKHRVALIPSNLLFLYEFHRRRTSENERIPRPCAIHGNELYRDVHAETKQKQTRLATHP